MSAPAAPVLATAASISASISASLSGCGSSRPARSFQCSRSARILRLAASVLRHRTWRRLSILSTTVMMAASSSSMRSSTSFVSWPPAAGGWWPDVSARAPSWRLTSSLMRLQAHEMLQRQAGRAAKESLTKPASACLPDCASRSHYGQARRAEFGWRRLDWQSCVNARLSGIEKPRSLAPSGSCSRD